MDRARCPPIFERVVRRGRLEHAEGELPLRRSSGGIRGVEPVHRRTHPPRDRRDLHRAVRAAAAARDVRDRRGIRVGKSGRDLPRSRRCLRIAHGEIQRRGRLRRTHNLTGRKARDRRRRVRRGDGEIERRARCERGRGRVADFKIQRAGVRVARDDRIRHAADDRRRHRARDIRNRARQQHGKMEKWLHGRRRLRGIWR